MQLSLLKSPHRTNCLPLAQPAPVVEVLQNHQQDEVLAFLERRPVFTACMVGLIRDNGLESPFNRGKFYGCRDAAGQLEGVALIGHATLIETASDRSIQAFAITAQSCQSLHLLMCEETKMDQFWAHYSVAGRQMRRACRQLLFELRWPIESPQIPALRLATLEDLPLLLPVHAEMAASESGRDPRQQDAAGFFERYSRRIQQGRTWVLIENGKLQFKADVIGQTPEAAYIEGVWVNPETRGQGYGRRCMSQLARMLLLHTKSLCLFVNDENDRAQSFYKRAGCHLRAVYDTVFLN